MDDYFGTDSYFDPGPDFGEIDTGDGVCPQCGAFLRNGGAHSDGDGDLYDLVTCPICDYVERANEIWFDAQGGKHDDYDEMNYWNQIIYDEEIEAFIVLSNLINNMRDAYALACRFRRFNNHWNVLDRDRDAVEAAIASTGYVEAWDASAETYRAVGDGGD